MKALSDIILPDDRLYTDEHVWVKKNGEELILGISDFAQDQLGEVVFVDLPGEGDHFDAKEGFGTVESIKSVNTLFMPVAGEISAVNENVDDTPTLVNASCYENGWMVRIKADSAADADALFNAAAYREFLNK